jgi:hypothetical protein
MTKQTQHDYLMTLLKELEKEGNQIKLDNFTRIMEDLLQLKYRVRNYFDYPISAAQYDELITYAETLLGVDVSGRTKGATSAHGASSDVDSFNTMTDIEVEALVDYALVDMKLVKHVLKNYTPDQLTIDIVKQAAAGHMVDGVRVNVIDGMKVNKQTADYIEMKIKQIQRDIDSEGEGVASDTYPYTERELKGAALNGLYEDQWIAFTAKQDIKKGDFVLIDEHDNQSVTPAKDMELSPTTLEDLFKDFEMDRPEMKVETTNADLEKRMNDFFELSNKVMEEYKEAYAALGSHDDGYYSGALYNLDDVKKAMEQAQEGYKTIWYFEPFQQFFVGNIRDKADFPFIYLNEDPSHSDYVKHTPVVGPFNNIREMEDYFDLMVHEETGMYDSDFVKHLRGLVVMIKHYESKDDAHNYSTIIDKLWENLKSFLLGNI